MVVCPELSFLSLTSFSAEGWGVDEEVLFLLEDGWGVDDEVLFLLEDPAHDGFLCLELSRTGELKTSLCLQFRLSFWTAIVTEFLRFCINLL